MRATLSSRESGVWRGSCRVCSGSHAADDLVNSLGRRLWVFVLPCPQDVPPVRCKALVVSLISPDVSLNLRGPIVRIGSRTDAVFRAPMPEAAVDEDSHLLSTKHDVGTAIQARHRPHVLSEPKASAMEYRPDCLFWLGVGPPVSPHHRRGTSGARLRRSRNLGCSAHYPSLSSP